MVWILAGYFITFIVFFVIPIFFDPSRTMKFDPYLFTFTPIGHDFNEIVSSSASWLQTHNVPVILYPSFTLLFFAPFTLLSPQIRYSIITSIIIACYILMTLLLPKRMNKLKGVPAFIVLILVAGFISYGFQFELERGQWNMIAMAFCLAAIYIFHYRPRYRWLAYVMFSISVQLKLYPAIFVLVLIDDWSDWKNNVKRVIGLGILNLLALFILGVNPLLASARALSGYKASNSGRPFNLSITSFSLFLVSADVLPHKRIVLWLLSNNWVLQIFFWTLVILCMLITLRQAYIKRPRGFDPYVFLACSIGACVIPATSFDYKLSMLPACIAISLPGILDFNEPVHNLLVAFFTFILSLAYSSTLYSYAYKPVILQNNFPALLIILLVCTLLSLRKAAAPKGDLEAEDTSARPPISENAR